jgi:hypothetical protein
MSTGEMRDIKATRLLDEQVQLYEQYHQAIAAMQAIVGDFSEGSQQRFMTAQREVTRLRDELWYLQQHMFRLDKRGDT